MTARLSVATDPVPRLAPTRLELALHLGLGRRLAATGVWASPKQVRTYRRPYKPARRVEMVPELLLAFYMQADLAADQGEYGQALILSERFFNLARQSCDAQALGLPNWALGSSHFVRRKCVVARDHLEAAWSLYRRGRSGFRSFAGPDMSVSCLSWLSLTLCTLGYPEQALLWGCEALALARELDLLLSLGMALVIAGCTLNIYCRHASVVRDYATELLALARAKGLVLFQEWADIALGWCQVEAGEFETGVDRMHRGMRAWQQMGTVPGQFLHLALLAEACDRAGWVSQGLDYVDEAVALVRRVGSSNHTKPRSTGSAGNYCGRKMRRRRKSAFGARLRWLAGGKPVCANSGPQ